MVRKRCLPKHLVMLPRRPWHVTMNWETRRALIVFARLCQNGYEVSGITESSNSKITVHAKNTTPRMLTRKTTGLSELHNWRANMPSKW